MKITEEQELAQHAGVKGPMDRVRQKAKGERAYTNDEIAEHENLVAEIRAKLDDYQPERMRAALAALRGGAQQPGPQHLYRRVELGDGHISYQPVQETAQPVAWAILTDNGNIRMWSTINADVTAFAAQIGAVVIPLYPHPPQVTEGMRGQPQPVPASVVEALTIAEDILSRAPFSTGILPNGMHPQTVIEKVRAALTAARDTEGKEPTSYRETVKKVAAVREKRLAETLDRLCIVEADLSRLRQAAVEACDFLAERTYGNAARSPGHNARVRLESILKNIPDPQQVSSTQRGTE